MKYSDLIGKKIVIINMEGEEHYKGRVGIVQSIDDGEMVHGTWGGLALDLSIDTIKVIDEGVNR